MNKFLIIEVLTLFFLIPAIHLFLRVYSTNAISLSLLNSPDNFKEVLNFNIEGGRESKFQHGFAFKFVDGVALYCTSRARKQKVETENEKVYSSCMRTVPESLFLAEVCFPYPLFGDVKIEETSVVLMLVMQIHRNQSNQMSRNDWTYQDLVFLKYTDSQESLRKLKND